MDAQELRRTPLEPEHVALGAKLGPFGGWQMPIEYAGPLAEHEAVRGRVGLFDLTHLGKVELLGAGAHDLLQRVVSNDLDTAAVGEAVYSLVLNDRGGVIDDLIVYRLDDQRYFVVPNASNTDRVLQILADAEARQPLDLIHHQDWCFLAVQGPDSAKVVSALFPEASTLGFMDCTESGYRRRPVIVTRSGYTGEVGFELFTNQDVASALWAELLELMEPLEGAPCGLAARDVLRLEMGYPLYGQDLSESTSPLEAGLSWAVAFDKGDFTGREALIRQKEEGLPSRLRGLRMRERKHIPRAHCPVFQGDRPVGEVTSGTYSPLLRAGVGLAYLRPSDAAAIGDEVEVDIRGRRGVAEIVRPPFVDRSPR